MPVRSFSRRVVPIALSRPTALKSEFGVPRYLATVHTSRNLAQLAPKTTYEKLKAVDTFYGFTKERLGSDCLDQLIGDFATDKLEALLQAFFSSERNYWASSINIERITRARVRPANSPHTSSCKSIQALRASAVFGGKGRACCKISLSNTMRGRASLNHEA